MPSVDIIVFVLDFMRGERYKRLTHIELKLDGVEFKNRYNIRWLPFWFEMRTRIPSSPPTQQNM